MRTLALIAAIASPQDDIETLIDRLRTKDNAEWRRAVEELQRRGAEAVPAALRKLEDDRRGMAQEVQALVGRLSSKKWMEREEAMRDLVALGWRAQAFLEEHQDASDPEVAWRVRAAIAEIRRKAGLDGILEETQKAGLCMVLAEAGDARAVGPLLEILGGGTPEPRVRAAEALGKLRGKMTREQAEEAAERTLAALGGTRLRLPDVARARLIRALGGLGSSVAVRPLAALLADPGERDVDVKRAAMGALAACGDEQGWRALVEALGSPEAYARRAALEFLEPRAGSRFGYDPARPPSENVEAIRKFRGWWAKTFDRAWE